MSGDDVEPDRRGIDRRVEVLERELRQMETQVAVMQATLNGLVSTMESRHKAFERGQDLILKGIDTLEKAQLKIEADIKQPQDLSKIVFSPGVVVAIVMTIISIVAGQQASTWGMRSEQQLQAERMSAVKGAVEAVGRKQELFQIQVQEIRDEVRGRTRIP